MEFCNLGTNEGPRDACPANVSYGHKALDAMSEAVKSHRKGLTNLSRAYFAWVELFSLSNPTAHRHPGP